jgi:hypothetical protein
MTDTRGIKHNTGVMSHIVTFQRIFGKGKALPITGRRGSDVCAILRIQHGLDKRLTDGGKFVSIMHRPRFTPPKYFGFLLLLVIFVRG